MQSKLRRSNWARKAFTFGPNINDERAMAYLTMSWTDSIKRNKYE
jgi:hypothetical protein